MYTYIATAIAAASLAAAGVWKVQDWRYDARENEYAQQLLVNERAASTAAIRRTEAVIAAQNAAVVRAGTLLRDADAARAALGGLRDATASALRSSSANLSACTERATTLGQLLNDSAGAYQGMAEKADRHANDALMLIQAWPK